MHAPHHAPVYFNENEKTETKQSFVSVFLYQIFQLNAVLLAYLSDNAARISGCKVSGRNVARYNAAGTDDAAVADHNAAADGDITGKPAVAADAYRLCVLQIVCAASGLVRILRSALRNECIGVSRLQFGPKNTSSPIVTGQQSSTVKLKFA